MNLVITVPGVPATPVEFTAMVRADKWPWPGSVLPMEIDLDKPSRMRILWDEVPTARQQAGAAADRLAAQMNGGNMNAGYGAAGSGAAAWGASTGSPSVGMTLPGGFQIPPGARVVSSSVSINGQVADAAQIAAIESLTGMDLDGDGVIGPPPGG